MSINVYLSLQQEFAAAAAKKTLRLPHFKLPQDKEGIRQWPLNYNVTQVVKTHFYFRGLKNFIKS